MAGVHLTAVLHGQTRPDIVNAAELARRRVEKSVQKQRDAVAAQRRSLERQRPEPPAGDLVSFRPTSECRPLPPDEISSLVDTAAERTSVAPELIRAVMRQESGFRPCAVSPKGAMGLMQLIPGTAGEFGVTDAFDPEQNVLGGAKLLKQLLGRYSGDLSLTLSAYNAGTRPVDSVMGIPRIPETIDYVSRILAHLAPDTKPPDN